MSNINLNEAIRQKVYKKIKESQDILASIEYEGFFKNPNIITSLHNIQNGFDIIINYLENKLNKNDIYDLFQFNNHGLLRNGKIKNLPENEYNQISDEDNISIIINNENIEYTENLINGNEVKENIIEEKNSIVNIEYKDIRNQETRWCDEDFPMIPVETYSDKAKKPAINYDKEPDDYTPQELDNIDLDKIQKNRKIQVKRRIEIRDYMVPLHIEGYKGKFYCMRNPNYMFDSSLDNVEVFDSERFNLYYMKIPTGENLHICTNGYMYKYNKELDKLLPAVYKNRFQCWQPKQ